MARVASKSRRQVEFGDFQTPDPLAVRVAAVVASRGSFATIVEPTCGDGGLLVAAADHFPAATAIGLDIDPDHLARCRQRLGDRPARLITADFFATDWAELLAAAAEPVLVIGNPPWVTNAALATLASGNLPDKQNRARRRGIEAITGSSNFDISEWIVDHLAEKLHGRVALLAMLCKRAVARKVLARAWRAGRGPRASDLFAIDAAAEFGVSAAAGLLVMEFAAGASSAHRDCRCRDDLAAEGAVTQVIGWRGDQLIADLDRYHRSKHLLAAAAPPVVGDGPRPAVTQIDPPRWRSGVKHDCAKVMELTRRGDRYRNGFGEIVDLEPDYLYPMLKSSDLAHGAAPSRWMLVTQQTTGAATAPIAERAPRTFRYLEAHGELLDRRASSIYHGRPRFSVFGVGPYTFAPWKVAIAGLCKELRFSVVGEHQGKPTVVDDTGYFLACADRDQAHRIAAALGSPAARDFYAAFTFWDAKRPITAGLLQRLDLAALARHLADEPAHSPS